MTVSIGEQAAADRVSAALADLACRVDDPADPGHDHTACLDVPGAALADRLWRIAAAYAEGDAKAARVATRRLDLLLADGTLAG